MKLTKLEASEIYACLLVKRDHVQQGKYRCTISGDQSQDNFNKCIADENEIQIKWERDLTKLLIKIGDDGKNLCK